MSRRRTLMAGNNGWVNTGFNLSGFTAVSNTVASYSAETGELLIYTTQNGTYRNVYKAFDWQPGYEYMVDYDVTIFSGKHLSGFRTGASVYDPTSGTATTSRHINFIYGTQSYNIDSFAIFCTWDTSQHGACVISNFRILKRSL